MPETLSDIGEFGLIRRIEDIIQNEGVRTKGIQLGIGDDCAAFRTRAGYEVLVTCDCIVEGRHYLPQFIDPKTLGQRAMSLNISDIGAMGGWPLYALVSLGLRSDIPVSEVESMYLGFIAELNPLGASIIGGNITKSGDGVFIDITLIGEVQQDKMVTRSRARAGDVIMVTGYPGQAAAGLAMLMTSPHPEALHDHPLVKAYNLPSHRAREGSALARAGLVSAMIDTSDGLLGDLGHIVHESGVGAELFKERLPVSNALKEAARELKKDPYELVLQDSDDYELIIACSPHHTNQIRAVIKEESDIIVTEVGKFVDRQNDFFMILPDGSRQRLRPAGWDHFARR